MSLVEIEDKGGNRVSVPVSYWRRWPSVRETFRPVADEETAPAVIETPTGDEEMEN